jgi:hypothetical protein
VSRGKRRKGDREEPTNIAAFSEVAASAAKRAWARLIKQVYEVDPLVCPRCGSAMRTIAFIEQPEAIEKILAHLGLWPTLTHSPPVAGHPLPSTLRPELWAPPQGQGRRGFGGPAGWPTGGSSRGPQKQIPITETATEIVGTDGRLNRVEISDVHGIRTLTTPTFYERFADAFLREEMHFVDCVRHHKSLALTLHAATEATRIDIALRTSLNERRVVEL